MYKYNLYTYIHTYIHIYNVEHSYGWPIDKLVAAVGYGYAALNTMVVDGFQTWQTSCSVGGCPAYSWRNSWGGSGAGHEVSWYSCCDGCGWHWYGYFCSSCGGKETCADSGVFKVTQSRDESLYSGYILGRMCGSSSYGLGGFHGNNNLNIPPFIKKN